MRILKGSFKPKSLPSPGQDVSDDLDPGEAEAVLGAAPLSPDVWLVVIRLSSRRVGPVEVTVSSGGASPGPAARGFAYKADRGLLLLTAIDGDFAGFDVEINDENRPLSASEIAHAVQDLPTLVRNNLSGLEPAVRLQVMAFLTSALSIGSAVDRRLATNVHLVREALRQRLPYCEVKRDQEQGMSIDVLLAVDEHSFYVRGWAWDARADVTRLTLESPEGSRVELLGSLIRYPRPDIVHFYGASGAEQKDPGFISYFQTAAPSYLREGWIFEMQNDEGAAKQIKTPPLTRDILTVRNEILGDLNHRDHVAADFLEAHISPALSRLQERYRNKIEVERVEQYGQPHAFPEVSIIIPLYQRMDFLEQQLAQFVHDEDIRRADLIYVLDSPELADRLRDYAAQLFRLYGLPFRAVILNRNAGFSTANNIGASLARGRLLLLLNSDVLPDKPGWLASMTAFYDSKTMIGALGPKLLYEDDSLQHAGLYFHRPEGASEWENMHYYKGLHRLLPAANVARPVPAVTGACLLIDRDLYQETGGLHGLYVQGDYEDSDLCLRLIEAGRENWYDPNVELYHLEGQSYAPALRRHAQQYNQWLHTRLWGERIAEVMARYAARSVSAQLKA